MTYRFPDGLVRLRAFLGANGIRTSALETAHDVIRTTNALFGFAFALGKDDAESEAIMGAQQAVVAGIGYPSRRILVRHNLKTLPASILSTAPGNLEKVQGVMRKRDKRYMKAAKSLGLGFIAVRPPVGE